MNGGDIKATQGDSGHRTAEMVLNRYAHIIDQNRKVNTQKLNDQFYGANDTDSSKLARILKALQQSPEAIEMLSEIITTI